MNRHITRLNEGLTEQTASRQETSQQQLEFATAEEMIRHDAAQTGPPPALAMRLHESIAREPKPARAWWQRWLGQTG